MSDVTKVFRAAVAALELRKGGPAHAPARAPAHASPTGDFSSQSRHLRSCLSEAQQVLQVAKQAPDSEQAAAEPVMVRMLAACETGLAALAAAAAAAAAPGAQCGPQRSSHMREAAQILRERLQRLTSAHRASCQRRRRLAAAAAGSGGFGADSVPAALRRRQRPPTQQRQPQPEDPSVAALTPEERRDLQQESMAMLNELSALSGDTKQVESQLSEIAGLQRQFGERVLEQEAQIDRVHSVTAASVENVRDGNEQLRRAMQNKASLRFWLLFYLVVTSLTLWFLDWYND